MGFDYFGLGMFFVADVLVIGMRVLRMIVFRVLVRDVLCVA